MGRLRDHERPPLAHDALCLAQDGFDLARITLVAGELDRVRRRLERVDPDHPALRLRHGLLRDHEHVVVGELDQLDDHRRHVVPLPDLRQAPYGNERDHSVPSTPVMRTPACAL